MTHPLLGTSSAVSSDSGRAPASGSPVVALDVGGTQLRAAVVRADGTLVGRQQARTPRDADAAGRLAGECAGLVRHALAAAVAAGVARPQALGVSAPGPLDSRRGILLDPPNLHRRLWNFPLAQVLAEATGMAVAVDKDTNVAALAEGRFGAARGLADYVYLTVSTGVGGAAMSGGRLVSGADGVAGELGHVTVDPAGPPCGCGGRGHLEAFSSGSGIAARAQAAIRGGEAAPGTPLGRLAEKDRSASLRALEARDVALAEDEGDELAGRIMEEARQAFAAAMVVIVNVFNPARIIVGGGVAAGQGDRLLEPARSRVRREGFRVAAARAEIVPASLGADVSLVGALPLVADRIGAVGSAARPAGP